MYMQFNKYHRIMYIIGWYSCWFVHQVNASNIISKSHHWMQNTSSCFHDSVTSGTLPMTMQANPRQDLILWILNSHSATRKVHHTSKCYNYTTPLYKRCYIYMIVTTHFYNTYMYTLNSVSMITTIWNFLYSSAKSEFLNG